MYNNEEALPEMRKYIFKYLLNLEKMLFALKLIKRTILDTKSEFI